MFYDYDFNGHKTSRGALGDSRDSCGNSHHRMTLVGLFLIYGK